MSEEITKYERDLISFLNLLKSIFNTIDPLIEKKYSFNSFNVLKISKHEEQLSNAIAKILNYTEDDKYPFLELFIKEISDSLIIGDKPVIAVEYSTDENRRVDIIIEGENFFIGIENKSNNAPDQDKQIADYYNYLKGKKDFTKIIYMPIFYKDPSKKSLNGLDKKDYTDILIMPFCDYITEDETEKYDEDKSFKNIWSMSYFLKKCRKNTSEERMMFFLNEFIDYIEKYMEEKMDDEKVKIIESILQNEEFKNIALDIRDYFKEGDNNFTFAKAGLTKDDIIYLKDKANGKQIMAMVVSDKKIIEVDNDKNKIGEPTSLSRLAMDFLGKKSLQGPAYWTDEKGVTLLELRKNKEKDR